MPNLAAPSSIRFEHRTDATPVLGTATPRLSWQVATAPADYVQTAYEVEITSTTPQSFTVESAEQVLVPWPGEPLASRARAQVRVRVRGEGDWSAWSESAVVEVGLLSPDDWTARFVSPRDNPHGSPAPLISATLDL